MHILLISNLFPSSVEPTRATYNLNLAKGLAQLGHTISVVAPLPRLPLFDAFIRKRPRPPASEMLEGFRVWHPLYPYTPGCFIHRHHLMYRMAVSKRVNRICAKEKPDAAILGFIYPDAVAMAPVCRRLGLPYVLRVNGSDFRLRINDAKFSMHIKTALLKAPGVVCPGKALAASIQTAGIPGTRVTSFNNGVDHTVFHPRPVKTCNRILFVGNLISAKGVDRLVAAWALAGDQLAETEIDVLGEGPAKQSMKSFAASNGRAGRIHFHGRKTPDEVADFMRMAHCLCLPSRSEGMPNVILESLACGTPVVATSVGEVPYLIEEGLNGFVVDGTQPEEKVIEALSRKLVETMAINWDRDIVAERVRGLSWLEAGRVVADVIADVIKHRP